jgi:DNA polymerase V
MGHNYDVTGFQSPCAEFAEKPLSLDERYLTNRPSLFIIEAAGDSKRLGIFKGDKLLIDRSLHPKEGQLCLFVINNEFKLSCYFRQKHFALDSESEDFIWGVVTTLLREFTKSS